MLFLIPRNVATVVPRGLRSLSTTAIRMGVQHKPHVLGQLSLPVYAKLHEAKGKKGLTFEKVRPLSCAPLWNLMLNLVLPCNKGRKGYRAERNLHRCDVSCCPTFESELDQSEESLTSFSPCSLNISFYGQAKPEKQDLEKLSSSLEIPLDSLIDALGPDFYPHRGLGEMPPRDPVVYRLYECILVYGHPLKHLIHEKFGGEHPAAALLPTGRQPCLRVAPLSWSCHSYPADGIMSAIDFVGNVERVSDPKGDRCRVTLEGKFLPYRRW